MSSYYQDECRGCPECIGCGRDGKQYIVFVCDRCGKESTMEDFIEETGTDGKEYCFNCVCEMDEEQEEEEEDE